MILEVIICSFLFFVAKNPQHKRRKDSTTTTKQQQEQRNRKKKSGPIDKISRRSMQYEPETRLFYCHSPKGLNLVYLRVALACFCGSLQKFRIKNIFWPVAGALQPATHAIPWANSPLSRFVIRYDFIIWLLSGIFVDVGIHLQSNHTAMEYNIIYSRKRPEPTGFVLLSCGGYFIFVVVAFLLLLLLLWLTQIFLSLCEKFFSWISGNNIIIFGWFLPDFCWGVYGMSIIIVFWILNAWLKLNEYIYYSYTSKVRK